MPITDAISSVTSASTADTPSRIPTQTLTQDDFLKLLVAQMTSQDPLDPQTDTDFVAQMAQFSSLEQTKSMSSDLSKLSTQQEFSQAASLLGRTVQVQTGSDSLEQGVVTALDLSTGIPRLVVNGNFYDLSQVLSVTSSLEAH